MLDGLYKWDCGEVNSIEEIEKVKRHSWNFHTLALISTTLLSCFSFDHPSYFFLLLLMRMIVRMFL